jgi:hypothetical protein
MLTIYPQGLALNHPLASPTDLSLRPGSTYYNNLTTYMPDVFGTILAFNNALIVTFASEQNATAVASLSLLLYVSREQVYCAHLGAVNLSCSQRNLGSCNTVSRLKLAWSTMQSFSSAPFKNDRVVSTLSRTLAMPSR